MSVTLVSSQAAVVDPIPSVSTAVSAPQPGVVRLVVEVNGSDPRSSQVHCTLRIENQGSTRVCIRSMEALIPPGAIAEDVVNSRVNSGSIEIRKLRDDISVLLTAIALQSSTDFRDQFSAALKDSVTKAMKPQGMMSLYFSLFSGQIVAALERYTTESRAWSISIYSAAQARAVYTHLVVPHLAQLAGPAALCDSKINALRELEEAANGDGEDVIADVDAGSVFSRTYIFSCKRRLMSPKTYTFAFECTYTEGTASRTEVRQLAASIAAVVSPKPLVLNMVAIVSAMLGAVLKIALGYTNPAQSAALENGGAATPAPAVFLMEQLGALVTIGNFGHLIAAVITALFFFNLYDSTDIGKKINVGTGWRSALLIGGLSGLVNERVVAALQGLLG